MGKDELFRKRRKIKGIKIILQLICCKVNYIFTNNCLHDIVLMVK